MMPFTDDEIKSIIDKEDRLHPETRRILREMKSALGVLPTVNDSDARDSTASDTAGQHVPGGVQCPDSNPKTAVGIDKPSTVAIPPVAILHLGQAMADGARKYGRFNWREHSVTASIYVDAIERHMLAWRDGEDIAPDSGAHHLAHVMACCAILLDASSLGKLNDDRGPKGVAGSVIDAWSKRS